MRRAVTLVLLSLAVATGGCDAVGIDLGGLDTGPLEGEIEADIEADAEGIDIDRVDCPDNIQPQRGDVFACRVHAVDGSVGTVEVRQVDDEGAVEWRLTDVQPPASEE